MPPKSAGAILGPGTIARAFAGGIAHSRTGTLVALGSRDPGGADLSGDFAGARVHAGYDALLADPEVDAVYIAGDRTRDEARENPVHIALAYCLHQPFPVLPLSRPRKHVGSRLARSRQLHHVKGHDHRPRASLTDLRTKLPCS